MNYIKQNHLSLLIILFLVGSSLMGGTPNLGALDRTTVGNPWTFSGAVTMSSTLTNTGTTTVTTSNDGFVVGGTMSTAATGTVRTLYTNTTGPKICDADTAALYVKNNGSFAPSVRFSVGTSTSAVQSTNLVASTTVATTTSAVVEPITSEFVLGQGNVITGMMDDNNLSTGSSTYYGNISAEFHLWCNQSAL